MNSQRLRPAIWRPSPRNQAAAVEVDCGDTKDLSTEFFRSLAEVLQEGIRHVDCDGHRFSLARYVFIGNGWLPTRRSDE